jgi:cellulose synthase (UDP-forming)
VLATTPQGLANAIATFRDNAKAPDIQGDLAIVSGGVVSSYRAAPTYTVGALPFWIWPSYALRDKPYISIIILIVGCVLLGFAFYWAMRRRANRRARQGPVA